MLVGKIGYKRHRSRYTLGDSPPVLFIEIQSFERRDLCTVIKTVY